MKGQMSFFAKVLIIVIASVAFFLTVMYMSSFRKSTAEEREISRFKMESVNVLQKMVSDGNCLAFEQNGRPQKGVVDIDKLSYFVSNYNETEPECAKALGFDYNIRVVQFPHVSRTYPILEVKKICYKKCWWDDYDEIWICYEVCTNKTVLSPSYNVSIKSKAWVFGVPEDTFSPKKARLHELQISLPVALRYNETFTTEGILYFYAAKGELEEVYSLIEDLCEKSRLKPDTNIKFSRYFYFSYPVRLVDGKLCMLNSCKKIVCSHPIQFKNFDEGEHQLTFMYDSSSESINIL